MVRGQAQKAGAEKTRRARNQAPARKKAERRQGSGFRSLMETHQRVAVDSLSRLLLDPASSLLTWAVIGIALALPVCLLLFLQNIQQLNTGLDEAGNISLFMERGLPVDTLEQARHSIAGHAGVRAVVLITAEQGLLDFQRDSGFGDALDGLDENPLPPVLEVTPAGNDVDDILALARELGTREGVDYAQYDVEWLQRLFGIIDVAQRVAAALAVLLCVGVILVVGNTIRLAIENRRDEIRVVKLVGGTDAYVSRPFLYTGLWYGVGGGLAASLLVIMVFVMLQGPFGRLMALYGSSYDLVGLKISDLLILLAVSGGLGLTGAWLSVTRHLRRIEP